MVKLDDVKSYANEKETFSIPQIQKDLGIGYFDARKFVNELVDSDFAVPAGGITYKMKRTEGGSMSAFRDRAMRSSRQGFFESKSRYDPRSPLFGIRIKENILSAGKYSVRVDRKGECDMWLEMPACKLFDEGKFKVRIVTDGDKLKLTDGGLWLIKRDMAGKKTPENEKKTAEILSESGVKLENGEISVEINESNAFEGFMSMYSAALRILSL